MSTPSPIPDNLLQKRLVDNRQVLYFNNREAYLAGIYPDISTLDGINGDTSSTVNATVDYRPKMEFLAKYRNNFFRHWVIFYPLYIDEQKLDPRGTCEETSESVTSAGVPWRKRYSPFLYNTTQKKWNLSLYNEEFFRKLRLMVQTAYDYGIIVQLTLFDRCGLDFVEDDKCKRWPYSPWNYKNNIHGMIKPPPEKATGLDEFYRRELSVGGTTLGALQDGYLNKVVSTTVEFPNVVYEIMNEPKHTFPDARNLLKRARWADAVVGVIYKHTQGKRFIFYNDHTNLGNWPERGADVLAWAQPNNGTSNFSHLDGVIFHGNVKAVDPGLLKETLRRNLIIQVSTDTFTGQNKEYHRLTTVNAFTRHMMFQAEAISDENTLEDANAAAGIYAAAPQPTLFKLPPLAATWVKTTENPAGPVPHLCFTLNADESIVSMNPDNDHVSMRGRVIRLYANKLVFWNETLHREGAYEYALTNGSQTLTLKRGDAVQVYQRYAGEFLPFLYQWEMVSQTPASSVAPFYVFIYPDATLRTRWIDNFEVTGQAKIVKVTTAPPRRITIKNATLSNETTWDYSFSPDGRQMTLSKVVSETEQGVTRVYRRLA